MYAAAVRSPRSQDGPVAGVVLAAGLSTRFGSDKRLFVIEGETLVRRAVRVALAGGLRPVLVVVGPFHEGVAASLLTMDCRLVVNPKPELGSRSSLRAGLQALPADVLGAVVLLVDMPRVDVAMVRAVAEALTGPHDLVRSRYGASFAPPTAIGRARVVDLCEGEGDDGGRSLFHGCAESTSVLDWPQERLADLDRPQDADGFKAP